MGDPSTYGILVQNYQSVLAFPFWLFNDNNWSNLALRSNQIVPGMPQEFYTRASIVAPYQAIEFNQGMFALFVVLQGLAMLFFCGVLFWVWFYSEAQPETSGFPLFEAKYRSEVTWDMKLGKKGDPAQIEVSQMFEGMRDAAVFTRGPNN